MSQSEAVASSKTLLVETRVPVLQLADSLTHIHDDDEEEEEENHQHEPQKHFGLIKVTTQDVFIIIIFFTRLRKKPTKKPTNS